MSSELLCAFHLSENEEVEAKTVHRGTALCVEHFAAIVEVDETNASDSRPPVPDASKIDYMR